MGLPAYRKYPWLLESLFIWLHVCWFRDMSGESSEQIGSDTPRSTKTTKGECNVACEMHELDEQSSWETQKSLLWQSLPLALLLIISVFVQNIVWILVFVALLVTFDCVNDGIIKQAERSRGVQSMKTVFLLIYIVICICLSYPVASNHWLFAIHNFKGWWSRDVTFWSTLFLVAVLDFVLKYATVIFKCVLLLLSGRIVRLQNRGRMFMTCEGVSQVFRCLLPIPEWSKYILTSEMCFSKVICWLLLVLYIFLKFKAVKKKAMVVVSAWRYRTVTGAKLQPAESQDISAMQDVKLCPICHENYLEPVKLPCGHIFCTGCISIWFDREKNCPKCSSDAINSLVLGFQTALPLLMQYTSSNNKWKTGATDYVIQFF